MHKLKISAVIDFLSKDCKTKEHQNCHGNWTGLGFKVICCCLCHKKSLDVKEKKGVIQSSNFNPIVDQPTSKINTLCLNEDIGNKKQDSIASCVGLRNRELASESMQIESF